MRPHIKRFLLIGTLVVILTGSVHAAELVGSFDMNVQGPAWQTNPPTYNALEACALLFGGLPLNYAASVSDSTITHTAWVSGWGDGQYCTTPAAETFKLNTFYNCGSTGCAYSAFVADHCSGRTTYCWRVNAITGTDVPAVSPWGFAAVFAALAAFGVFRLRA